MSRTAREGSLSEAAQRDLVAIARDGDEAERRAALEELVADFRASALAAIHRALAVGGGGREHAEEAFQAAVLRFVAAGIGRYRGEATPRSYFVRIAINAALDLLRLQRREGASEEAGERPAPGPSAEARLQARREREALGECLEALASTLREAIALYYLEEAGDCAACASRIGIGTSAFEQRLHRGRLALADCLRRKLEER